MAIVNDTVSFTIKKTMDDMGDVFDQLQNAWNGKAGKLKENADEVMPYEYRTSTASDKLAVGFYGTKHQPMGFKKNWALQIYFIEENGECRVFLAAIGNSKLDSFWHGKSQVIDLQYSIEVRNDIVNRLKMLNSQENRRNYQSPPQASNAQSQYEGNRNTAICASCGSVLTGDCHFCGVCGVKQTN